MKRKRITMSIVLATLMLVSLFSVVSSAASVSGQASGTTAPLSTNLIGGTMAGTGPAAATSYGTSQTLIFAVDTSHHVWYTSEMPSGGGVWNSLGGYATSSPAAVSRDNNGGFTVFARGTNGSIYYRDYVKSSWGPWISIGGQVPVNVGPAACSWGGGRLDVFVEGMNGGMYHRSYTTTARWVKDWDYLGGALTSGPAAVSPFTASDISVFVRGTNGSVYQRSYNNGWSGWVSLGGQLAPNTGLAVSRDLWLIVQGVNHQLYQKVASNVGDEGAFAPALSSSSKALSASSPGAVLVNGHTLVCFSSTSGNVWYGVQGDVTGLISQWYSLGSPPQRVRDC